MFLRDVELHYASIGCQVLNRSQNAQWSERLNSGWFFIGTFDRDFIDDILPVELNEAQNFIKGGAAKFNLLVLLDRSVVSSAKL